MHNEKKDGFPVTSLREIGILKNITHPHCVQLHSVVTNHSTDSDNSSEESSHNIHIFLVFEYCEHDLSTLMKTHQKNTQSNRHSHTKQHHHNNSNNNSNSSMLFTEAQVKTLIKQLLQAVQYLHKHGIIHRDIKLSNILYNNRGKLCVVC